MQRFFNHFEQIQQCTLSLSSDSSLKCCHCHQTGQLVSHGVVYRQRSIDSIEKVGKRVYCSTRYGRKGCGRTYQLYVRNVIPGLRYSTEHLWVFLSALLAGLSVVNAWHKATHSASSRQAWRWLNHCFRRLTDYRRVILVPSAVSQVINRFGSRKLTLLLGTVKQLLEGFSGDRCQSYQRQYQCAFI